MVLVGSACATVWWLRNDAAAVVAELPEAARTLRAAVRGDGKPGPLAHVQQAAAELDKALARPSCEGSYDRVDAAPGGARMA
jgi:hypothetical protein